MRVGVHVGHWEGQPHDVAWLAREAEACGLDSVWVSETWGSDAVALCAAMAANTSTIGIGAGVLQMPARTPATTAMAALTLDHLSGGRFRLGLGLSGPQVAEGWHGARFDHASERSSEYVGLVRRALAREGTLTGEGPHYPLPLPGGAGKPLKANVSPLRADLPLYLAAMGPRNVALAAEVADGWLPLFFCPERVDAFELPPLRAGFDVAPMVHVAIGPDLDVCRDEVRPLIALYVGAFGPRGGNFYHQLVTRFGFGEAADRIQEAALTGGMADATAAVPDALVDAIALVGPAAMVCDRLAAFADAGATTVLARTKDATTIRVLAEAIA